MAAGPKIWTEETIAERFSAGCGQGIGPNYTPWLKVQEFSSYGTQTRVHCPLVGRPVHTFSYIERDMLHFLEFVGIPVVPNKPLRDSNLYDMSIDLVDPNEPQLDDYREQFPLDRRVTMPAAKLRRYRHPRYSRTGVPMVMYLDAMLTYRRRDQSRFLVAWDAKPFDQLSDRRALQKLALHRDYCDHIEVPHYVFTERSVPKSVRRNLSLIRAARPRTAEESTTRLFEAHRHRLQGRFSNVSRGVPLWRLCEGYDKDAQLRAGTAIRIVYWLVWTKQLIVNLDCERLSDRPASTFRLPRSRS
jgi:hypothetical protein